MEDKDKTYEEQGIEEGIRKVIESAKDGNKMALAMNMMKLAQCLEEQHPEIKDAIENIKVALFSDDFGETVLSIMRLSQELQRVSPAYAIMTEQILAEYGMAAKPFADALVNVLIALARYRRQSATRAINENREATVKFQEATAQTLRDRLDSLVGVGFSREEAFCILMEESKKQPQIKIINKISPSGIQPEKKIRLDNFTELFEKIDPEKLQQMIKPEDMAEMDKFSGIFGSRS